MDRSIMEKRYTFRDEVHMISPIVRPDGSHNTYTTTRHAAQYDCFAANRAAMKSIDDGWEGY